jgi:hypothetical protein
MCFFVFGNFVILKSWQKFLKHSETSCIYTRDRNLSKTFLNVLLKKEKKFKKKTDKISLKKINDLGNAKISSIISITVLSTMERHEIHGKKNIKHELKVANSIIRMN